MESRIVFEKNWFEYNGTRWDSKYCEFFDFYQSEKCIYCFYCREKGLLFILDVKHYRTHPKELTDFLYKGIVNSEKELEKILNEYVTT